MKEVYRTVKIELTVKTKLDDEKFLDDIHNLLVCADYKQGTFFQLKFACDTKSPHFTYIDPGTNRPTTAGMVLLLNRGWFLVSKGSASEWFAPVRFHYPEGKTTYSYLEAIQKECA